MGVAPLFHVSALLSRFRGPSGMPVPHTFKQDKNYFPRSGSLFYNSFIFLRRGLGASSSMLKAIGKLCVEIPPGSMVLRKPAAGIL